MLSSVHMNACVRMRARIDLPLYVRRRVAKGVNTITSVNASINMNMNVNVKHMHTRMCSNSPI